MINIKLERGIWALDEADPLGPPGGFGEVFRGQGADGEVAIKRLKITASAAAHREMKIGKNLASRNLEHVVPVFDYGQDADSDRYYLVMPVCERSLQDFLYSRSPLTWGEAKPIALDIIAGLSEVGDIVHRDLKPGNVLWYQGTWQIADFGIAKFVEDSTSLETLRNSLTPPYAAPEQWLGEAPTRATDVYALACIMHTMINGNPPFRGDMDVIRRAHLNDQPPALDGAPARLNSLVTTMLRKTAASRPSLERCATVFQTIDALFSRPANAALAAAGQVVAQQEAEAEANRRAEETSRRQRQLMGNEAIADLKRMIASLFDDIEASSESAQREARAIVLGPAHLSCAEPELLGLGRLSGSNPHDNGWDVVAHTSIRIRAQVDRYSARDLSTYTFAATLIYARAQTGGEYRWREVSFWTFNSSHDATPFALRPDDSAFRAVTSRVIGGTNIAHGPLTIDAEDEDDFHHRWLVLFAKAVEKKLNHPMQMPVPKRFFE